MTCSKAYRDIKTDLLAHHDRLGAAGIRAQVTRTAAQAAVPIAGATKTANWAFVPVPVNSREDTWLAPTSLPPRQAALWFSSACDHVCVDDDPSNVRWSVDAVFAATPVFGLAGNGTWGAAMHRVANAGLADAGGGTMRV